VQQFGRQTDGPVDVVSRDAELDHETVTRVEHPSILPEPAVDVRQIRRILTAH
jgi:hypothetical protein